MKRTVSPERSCTDLNLPLEEADAKNSGLSFGECVKKDGIELDRIMKSRAAKIAKFAETVWNLTANEKE